MTTHDRDKVIAAAREARINKTWNSPEWYIVFERFYAIAFEAGRVAEREECAKLATINRADLTAEAIRARSTK